MSLPRSMPVMIVNHSTVVQPLDCAAAIGALQHQVSYDFQPYWGQGAHLYTPATSTSPMATIAILDDSDQAGALGYHDWTTTDGYPLAKVFARTDQQYGLSWTVTASHELLEMLADPYVHDGSQDDITARWYAREVCDPIEADALGYTYNNVLLSDFITPMWFHSGAKAPYDFKNHLTAPMSLASKGYMSYWDNTGWHQKQLQQGQLVDAPLGDNPRFRVGRRRTAK